MHDILNRSTLCSSSPNIRRNEETMPMLFVNVQSIWNCTSYSFENDDDDEKENIVQTSVFIRIHCKWNGAQFYDEKNEKTSKKKVKDS